MCNTKFCAIALLLFFSFLPSAIFGPNSKSVFISFNLLNKTHLTGMGPVSLDTLASGFGLVLCTIILGVDDQSLFSMHVEVCLKPQCTMWIVLLMKVIYTNLQ